MVVSNEAVDMILQGYNLIEKNDFHESMKGLHFCVYLWIGLQPTLNVAYIFIIMKYIIYENDTNKQDFSIIVTSFGAL